MRKLNERKLTAEVERKARELADTVAASSKLSPDDEDKFGFDYEQIILKACRKSVIDGFPLQDYFLGEVPYGDSTGVLAYFENISEYGMGENYNPEAHEIIFWCPYSSKIAVPHMMCGDMGFYNEERRNCFDAVYRLEHPQKSRRVIRNLIPKIIFNFRYRKLYKPPHIKILVITDLHDWNDNELELISGLEYDCCCLLGDVSEAALKVIKQKVEKPMFGILGNHDSLDTLSGCGITNINGKSVTVNGVTIAGLGGSHRYKPGNYPMLTQEESIVTATACPPGDILISHDTAFHVMGRSDNAHCGLKGIAKYIKKNKPKLNICGHYHENVHKKYKRCDILCVYRCALVTFPENKVEIIF